MASAPMKAVPSKPRKAPVPVAPCTSPMVVIRVTPMKPSVVVLHGIKEVDPLAIKIAEREQIPVIATNMDIVKLKEALNKI